MKSQTSLKERIKDIITIASLWIFAFAFLSWVIWKIIYLFKL